MNQLNNAGLELLDKMINEHSCKYYSGELIRCAVHPDKDSCVNCHSYETLSLADRREKKWAHIFNVFDYYLPIKIFAKLGWSQQEYKEFRNEFCHKIFNGIDKLEPKS